jgi:GNAT superfamily N-acetyltransferase
MSSFLIRDGLESDLAACLALDHACVTEFVWQMSIQQGTGQWQVLFKTERLPRSMEVMHRSDAARLHLALAENECFLVAVSHDNDDILGYLTMRSDPVHHIALIQDIVVASDYRRHRIATRLLHVARQWAREHDHLRLTIETQTKNYPAIQFCQSNGLNFCGFNDHYFPNGDIAVFFTQSLRS